MKSRQEEQIKRRRPYKIEWKGNAWVGGEAKKKKKRRKPRVRALKTYNNKLRRVEHQYRHLSKNKKFKAKYPTLKDFLAIIKLKQMGFTGTTKSSSVDINTLKNQVRGGLFGIK